MLKISEFDIDWTSKGLFEYEFYSDFDVNYFIDSPIKTEKKPSISYWNVILLKFLKERYENFKEAAVTSETWNLIESGIRLTTEYFFSGKLGLEKVTDLPKGKLDRVVKLCTNMSVWIIEEEDELAGKDESFLEEMKISIYAVIFSHKNKNAFGMFTDVCTKGCSNCPKKDVTKNVISKVEKMIQSGREAERIVKNILERERIVL